VESSQIHQFNKAKELYLKDGLEILDVSMINPDIAPVRELSDRLIEFLSKPGSHKYSVSRGIRKIREAFALKYLSTFGVDLDAEKEICFSFGSKDAITQLLRICGTSGQTVLLPNPCYPAHKYATEYAGLSTSYFQVSSSESEMLVSIAEAVKKYNPRIILLNFPHNPTGAVVSENFYQELAKICVSKNTIVINDFVYGELVYPGSTNPSLLTCSELKNQAIEVYSLSKAYSIPGWRVACVAGTPSILDTLRETKSKIDFGLFIPMQLAAAWVLGLVDSPANAVAQEYSQRSSALKDLFDRIGISYFPSLAGCSLWCAVPKKSKLTGIEFALNLLEMGLAVLPGIAFGEEYSDNFRIALVAPAKKLPLIEDIFSKILLDRNHKKTAN
jgi:alanine-synthesizing transaminase